MDYSEEDLKKFISQCEEGIEHLTEQLIFYKGKLDESL